MHHPETSPSIPQEVHPAQLLNRQNEVVARGHVRIISETKGVFEMSLLEDAEKIQSSAEFISWGVKEPRKLEILHFESGAVFSHFEFALEEQILASA